jgi:hypothetical protein
MNLQMQMFIDPATDKLGVRLVPDEPMTIRANDGEPLQVEAGGIYEAMSQQMVRIRERVIPPQ